MTSAVVATFVRTRRTPQRDFVADPATFADVYAYSLTVAEPEPFLRGTGKSPFAHVGRTSKTSPAVRRKKIW
jgi:hypothetical protein